MEFYIGLPNGIHKWKVCDSREHNGAWKVERVREKYKLVLFRTAVIEPSATTDHKTSTSTTLSSSSSPPCIFQSIITTPGFATPRCSTAETQVIPSPWIDLQNMNFDRGLAGEFTIDILQDIVKKRKVRENLNSCYDKG